MKLLCWNIMEVGGGFTCLSHSVQTIKINRMVWLNFNPNDVAFPAGLAMMDPCGIYSNVFIVMRFILL